MGFSSKRVSTFSLLISDWITSSLCLKLCDGEFLAGVVWVMVNCWGLLGCWSCVIVEL